MIRKPWSRREWLGCGAVALGGALGGNVSAAAERNAAPAVIQPRGRVAITMDDFSWSMVPEPYTGRAQERLLEACQSAKMTMFVVGQNIDNEEGRRRMAEWSSSRHEIANHTWSHRPITKLSLDDFQNDMLRADAALKQASSFQRRFRFPMLKEGATREARDGMRSFLRDHGYQNGSVTIDASDWYYSMRLQQRLKAEPGFAVERYREPYLAHLWDRAQYYDGLSQAVVKRSIPHTLLVHYNLINVLFLGDVVKMFRSKGWAVVGSDEAFADPVFQQQPDNIPAGESLIWALAKTSGRFEDKLRYPGESDEYEKPKLEALGL